MLSGTEEQLTPRSRTMLEKVSRSIKDQGQLLHDAMIHYGGVMDVGSVADHLVGRLEIRRGDRPQATRSPGQSKNPPGPKWHPERTQKRGDARPERARVNITSGGDRKRDVCKGMYLLKNKKKKGTKVVNADPKTKRTSQKRRPDNKIILTNLLRGERKATKTNKNVGKTPLKTQDHNKTAKTKIRS